MMKKIFTAFCAACAMVLTISCDKYNPRKDPTGGVEIVDLGLSVDWASWNVGATSETDFGSYLAWGETAEKEDYSWATYELGTYDSSASPDKGMTKYNKSDGITELAAEDDPATSNWGARWRSPTIDEMKELSDVKKCEWKWTDRNGVEGYLVTSKVPGFEGRSIFLPAAGIWNGSEFGGAGRYGYYWSSSLQPLPIFAYGIEFYSSIYNSRYITRNCGQSVRAVTNPHPERDPYNGHKYVDLGLAVKWATCNVGAKSETDYGQYFAWGETEEKKNYSWSTHDWGKCEESAADFGLTKYNGKDGFTTFEAEDDPATANWGSKWRTPTCDEFEELLDKKNCDWVWEAKKDSGGNDVYGCTVTSKTTGKSIFLPAAGDIYYEELMNSGNKGFYWSSSFDCSVYPYKAAYLNFSSKGEGTLRDDRCFGLSIRPVTE